VPGATSPDGTTTTLGNSPNAPGTTGTGQSCDPNTGICSTAAAGTGNNGGTVTLGSNSFSSGQAVNDQPISLAGSNGDGVEVTLMALAAGMMFLVSVLPPLFAQAGRRSRQRRGIDEYYNDDRNWDGR
jgi:hypothetical protein